MSHVQDSGRDPEQQPTRICTSATGRTSSIISMQEPTFRDELQLVSSNFLVVPHFCASSPMRCWISRRPQPREGERRRAASRASRSQGLPYVSLTRALPLAAAPLPARHRPSDETPRTWTQGPSHRSILACGTCHPQQQGAGGNPCYW